MSPVSDGPAKRSHQLALDNVRRIAETLREERNNLMLLLQEQRELLSEAMQLLATMRPLASPEQQGRIDELVNRTDAL